MKPTSPLLIVATLLLVSACGDDKGPTEPNETMPPQFLLSWGTPGSGNGQFDAPVGLAIDSEGNVYVADSGNRRIQVFDQEGNFLTKWDLFDTPYDICFDASGRAYVTVFDPAVDEFPHECVLEFDADGQLLASWGVACDLGEPWGGPIFCGSHAFDERWGVQASAVDGGGNVFVLNGVKVFKFDNERQWLWDVGGTCLLYGGPFDWDCLDPDGDGPLEEGDGEFGLTTGLALDANGDVYIVDSWNHRIQKLDTDGNFLTKWDAAGPGPGEFLYPNNIAFDGAGNFYVTEVGNNRVQKFDREGNFLTTWGRDGTGDGEFRSPGGIAVDRDGNVYVVDSLNNRIQKFGTR